MGSCSHGSLLVLRAPMTPVPGSGRMEQLAQAVAERVVSIVMDAIDIDALLERIDVDALVSRVDVDGVVNRVDVDKLIDRVDVEKIIERVDVEKIIERVDIDKLMEQTELGSIIARSTTRSGLRGPRRHPGPGGRARRLLRPVGEPHPPSVGPSSFPSARPP